MATREEQRSIGELFGQLTQDLNLLIRQEIALARAEVTQKVNRAKQDAVSLLAGGFVAYLGALTLVAALVLILDQVIGLATWLAALLVGAALAVVGYVMLQRGLRDLRQIDPTPRRTVETLKDDVQWAKEQRS
jgi:VIT1/CCC1 family predicted Fe2+/Mn2+ transporter